jgi:hypothetical protein
MNRDDFLKTCETLLAQKNTAIKGLFHPSASLAYKPALLTRLEA